MSIIVKVERDDSAESPRTAYDNLGTMACWHRRYNLGDVQPKESPEEWLAENAPEGSVVLPLYLFDHSGISMSTGSFNDRWDSGRIGYIVLTPDQIRKEFSVKRITAKVRAKVTACLEQEVKTYDDYLTGNVWGYYVEAFANCGECGSKIAKMEGSDSCLGFIGSDPSTLDAMKEHISKELHPALEKAWENRC